MKHNSSTGTHAGSLGQLLELTGPFRFLREPGGWFFAALALGLGVRLYLLLATPGTTDMLIWDMHARGVSEQGLIPYYHVGRKFWRPPFVRSLQRVTSLRAAPRGLAAAGGYARHGPCV